MRAKLFFSMIGPVLALACSAPAQDAGSRPAPTPAAAPAPAPTPTPVPSPAAQPPAAAGAVPVLPELREASDAFMEALLSGTLIEQSGCLRVSPDGKELGHLLIWQPGYTARRTGDRVEIVDGAGKVVARVGEPLRTGGGQVELNDALRGQLKAPLDAACVGPYWLMGQLQSP
ncbi:hypothetical protein OV090_42000 [Nannocystis sp. RBIL2]|uniref:hypothetical protein n=1 Tax=Nannocystis sp. RBIL2 TaxID=2996788 RepID=UPI00227040A2|nr:hypothetical protein [Nannocystis sp. RBIL2]MCY1071391.1 hypothetical protein [Nannocystis sp. RBIL2]